MSRPHTPKMKTDTGWRITVQRCCNGCGRSLGDVTDAEMDEVIAGLPPADVRDECGCEPWHDPTHGRIDRDIQEAVDEMCPSSLGQRVALENTMQERRHTAPDCLDEARIDETQARREEGAP